MKKERFLRYFSLFLLLFSLLFRAAPIPAGAEVLRSVATDGNRIALTFDDGPHPHLTPRILDILDRYGVRATFFMIGENVGYYPQAARAVAARGHEIGNHTFSHCRLAGVGSERARQELDECAGQIERVCGVRPRLFRPPEGAVDGPLLSVAGTAGYHVVLWSIDTRDWESKNTTAIVSRVLSSVKPGDVILMHDFIGHDSKTPEALEQLLPKLLALGYEPVTVSELFGVG